jgi:hypothetical protein
MSSTVAAFFQMAMSCVSYMKPHDARSDVGGLPTA